MPPRTQLKKYYVELKKVEFFGRYYRGVQQEGPLCSVFRYSPLGVFYMRGEREPEIEP